MLMFSFLEVPRPIQSLMTLGCTKSSPTPCAWHLETTLILLLGEAFLPTVPSAHWGFRLTLND